jgi:hypothetical protein
LKQKLDAVRAGTAIDDTVDLERPSAAADLRPKCLGIKSSISSVELAFFGRMNVGGQP